MTTERKFREKEVQIARYRFLEREVTDPLAASLLHIIILELEADLWVIREDHRASAAGCRLSG
jgi:hypothetical protein